MVRLTPVTVGSRFSQTTRQTAMPKIGGMRSVPTSPGGIVDISVDTFFTSKRVKAAVDDAKRKMLSRAGFLLRKEAMESMKWAPKKIASTPGLPPFAHRHSAGKNATRGKKRMARARSGGLRKSIMYGYDFARDTVVVGPSSVRGHNVHKVAATHEFGIDRPRANPFRTHRYVGGSGEIHIGRGHAVTRSTKKVKVGPYGWYARRMGGKSAKTVNVTYAKLRTAAQVARAEEIQRKLYGPVNLPGRYPRRKFMYPAMQKTVPTLPKMWANAVSV